MEANICHSDINEERWHKRGYHMYSDVVFGLIAWISLIIGDFLAEYLDFFSPWVVKLKNHTGHAQRRFAAVARSRSRCAAAGKKPPGARRCTPCGFSILPPILKKSQDISKKVPDIRQIHAISQKNVAISIITDN